MHLASLSVALLIALAPMVHGIEVVTQQIELQSSAQVTPANGSQGGYDSASRSNHGQGDRSLKTYTAASFEGVYVDSSAAIEVRRTNSATAEIFEMMCSLEVRSEDFLSLVSTQSNTRASAGVFHSFQARTEIPIRYHLRRSGTNSAGSGSFTITAQSGTLLLNHSWIAGTGQPIESTGVLPRGTYNIGFTEAITAEGVVSPAIVNHISGYSETLVTVTFTPAQIEPTPQPALRLSRDSAGRVVLELTQMRPGTYYTIERSDELFPNSWSFLVSLFAAGTEAVWTDTFNVHSPTTFYRLKY